MSFTRPDNNVVWWRNQPDRVQASADEVKNKLDEAINKNSDDLIGLIEELESSTGAASIGAAIGATSGTVQQALDEAGQDAQQAREYGSQAITTAQNAEQIATRAEQIGSSASQEVAQVKYVEDPITGETVSISQGLENLYQYSEKAVLGAQNAQVIAEGALQNSRDAMDLAQWNSQKIQDISVLVDPVTGANLPIQDILFHIVDRFKANPIKVEDFNALELEVSAFNAMNIEVSAFNDRAASILSGGNES